MKKTLLAGLMATTLISGNATADAARYFTQGDNPGSSIPYGDNLKVGN